MRGGVEQSYGPGTALVHPAGPHNFINDHAEAAVTFGVAYFVPVGATLLTPYTYGSPGCA